MPNASVEDADRAVQAARRAFDDGPWPRMTLDDRIDVLRAVSAAMAENEELLASVVTEEMGCPISLSRVMQSRNPRVMLDSFVEIAPAYEWSAVRRSATAQALVTREPIGVVVVSHAVERPAADDPHQDHSGSAGGLHGGGEAVARGPTERVSLRRTVATGRAFRMAWSTLSRLGGRSVSIW